MGMFSHPDKRNPIFASGDAHTLGHRTRFLSLAERVFVSRRGSRRRRNPGPLSFISHRIHGIHRARIVNSRVSAFAADANERRSAAKEPLGSQRSAACSLIHPGGQARAEQVRFCVSPRMTACNKTLRVMKIQIFDELFWPVEEVVVPLLRFRN